MIVDMRTIRYASFRNSSIDLRVRVGSAVGRALCFLSSSLKAGVRFVDMS